VNATVEEVQKVIQEEFPGADVSDIHETNHRISGRFDWPPFKAIDFSERFELVQTKIHRRFGLRGLNLGSLYPMAPGEKLN
jgi:hypothetical protein